MNIKLKLMTLGALLMTGTAMAAETYTLGCKVITNGSMKGWETIASQEVALKADSTGYSGQLKFKVKSPYGDSFTVRVTSTIVVMDSAADILPVLSQNVDFPASNIMMIQDDMDGGGKRDSNQNLANAVLSFVSKQSAHKWVTYSVDCHLK